MPPVSPELDEDIFHIQVGKELGIPAHDVAELPLYWLGSVSVLWEWQRRERERDARRSKSKSKPKTR